MRFDRLDPEFVAATFEAEFSGIPRMAPALDTDALPLRAEARAVIDAWLRAEQKLAAAAPRARVRARLAHAPCARLQLARARDILLDHRPPATPVVLARNLGRDGEQIRVTTLERLDPASVDMLTVILVGSSETRAVARADGSAWVYTPRGYGDATASETAS